MLGKRRLIPVFVVLSLALTGCANLAGSTQGATYPDDKAIARKGDVYTTMLWGGSLPDEIDMKGFTGTAALLELSVPECGGELAVDCDQAVSAGDFKTVLVRYGENADLICEGTGGAARSFSLEPGDYAIKAVGLDAAVHLAFQIRATDGVAAVVPGDAFDGDEPVVLEPLKAR